MSCSNSTSAPVLLAHPKIVNWEQAKNMVHNWQNQGEVVVFSNGCFDILHAGHVDLLARAKALGQRLVLGLNSDASVRSLNKSPERPINNQAQRAYVLAHLESIDAVVIFDEETPLKLIETLTPDILVKGGDWPVETIIGHEHVLKAGGKVFSLPLLANFSTTSIVHKLQK